VTNIFSRWFGKQGNEAPVRDVALLAAPLAAPAAHIVKTDAPSLSHFGGSPNLPPGRAWPDRNGTRLSFLARLSLAELHRTLPIDWLPEAGALLFFYDLEQQPWGFDPKDRGGWAVLLVPDLPAPSSQPSTAKKTDLVTLRHFNVTFRRVAALPSVDREMVAALNLSEPELDRYWGLAEQPFEGCPQHQVSGFPAPVQGDGMELECQLASHGIYCGETLGFTGERAESLPPGAADWRLLLQFDSDEDLDVMWGDAGTVYYWVEADAARAGRFENTWLILQCS
jgi:uncharacterized protein YwqG